MCPFARWGEQVVAFFSNKPRDAWRFIVVFLNRYSEGVEGRFPSRSPTMEQI